MRQINRNTYAMKINSPKMLRSSRIKVDAIFAMFFSIYTSIDLINPFVIVNLPDLFFFPPHHLSDEVHFDVVMTYLCQSAEQSVDLTGAPEGSRGASILHEGPSEVLIRVVLQL